MKIHNHTQRLSNQDIERAVEVYVKAHRGADAVEHVADAHAAAADDPKVLTKAVRLWRDAAGTREEFTQDVAGKIYWFGFVYAPG